MQYAFSPEFMYSGDLRIFLAMSPPDSDRNKLFQTLIKKDDLIQLRPGTPQVIGYDVEAMKRQEEWLRLCSSSAFITDKYGTKLTLGGAYAKGTCLLVGSGPSLNKDFVKEAAERGVVLIGTGNSGYLYPDVNLWIGVQDVISYLPIPFERNATLALVRSRYAEDNLWDPSTGKQVNKKIKDTVGVGFFEADSRSPEDLFKAPGISDFGIESTFTAVLSLAVSLGFNNIILNGIDMGGTLEKYFAFSEIPHQDTLTRKTMTYTKIRMQFPEWNRVFLSRGIRVVAVDSSPFDIPVFPRDYLREVLSTTMAMSRRLPTVKNLKITTPAEKKREAIRVTAKFHQAMLGPGQVLDKMDVLMTSVPDVFGAPDMSTVWTQLQEQLKKGGCSGCTKNRLARPIYDRFVKEVVSGSGKLDAIWKELFPNHYVIRTGPGDKELRFRSDAVKEREEFETMQ